jgi:branched-chain amino acid transport system substrate-binding protein
MMMGMRGSATIFRSASRFVSRYLGVAGTLLATPIVLLAQTPAQPAEPYAAINRSAISYSGPGREAAQDLPGKELKIGLILPLSGMRKAEGDALLAAAQLALQDESTTPFSGGRRITLAPRDESGLWGRAASEIVKLVVDDRALALVTSPDGRTAHLAEQVGNRLGVPVLSLSSDSQNTRINIPWYFRMVPDDAAQAELFAEHIYQQRKFRPVVIVVESDHDGKVGGEEFAKAVRRLEAPEPTRLEIASTTGEIASVVARIHELRPQAVVLWTRAAIAARLLSAIRISETAPELYACYKALQEPFLSAARQAGTPKLWTAAAGVSFSAPRADFDERFLRRVGTAPSPAAGAMYDAVRMIASGLRQAGPNRARLRDTLASFDEYHGVSGLISFDGAGNNQAAVALVTFQ